MTDLDITAIRERAEKATEGPWVSKGETVFATGGALVWVAEVEYGADVDAEFIAHTREDIPALLAALESSRAVVERLQGELDAQADSAEWEHMTVISGWDQPPGTRMRRLKARVVGRWLPVPTDGAEN